MNTLSNIITYIRRLIKIPSNAEITDNLLIDYINRFWIIDVDARAQLFDLKTKYQFQTVPGVDQYNMPLYNFQSETPGNPGALDIGFYPVYQGFTGNASINGVKASFYTSRDSFFNAWPNFVQSLAPTTIGNGTNGPYTITLPFTPNINVTVNAQPSGLLRGHVDMLGIVSTGANIDPPVGNNLNLKIPTTSIFPAVYFTSTDSSGNNVLVSDSGQFLSSNGNYGMLMVPGPAPYGNSTLPNGASLPTPYDVTQNTINYLTGVATNVYFPTPIPAGQNINSQCYFFNPGLPRSILFYNNVITLRSVPNIPYLVELDAYLSPAAFFNTEASIPFSYMSEYIARGAARKILSDTGDWEQFNAYEPLFKEQELLVWKRSQRQFTSTRTQTIYSGQGFQGNYNQSSLGGL